MWNSLTDIRRSLPANALAGTLAFTTATTVPEALPDANQAALQAMEIPRAEESREANIELAAAKVDKQKTQIQKEDVQDEHAPLSDQVKRKLGPLFEKKVLNEGSVNRSFNDPAYAKNLDYVLEKLQWAREGGLNGIDLNKVFALHPTVVHTIVRASYITFAGKPVLEPDVVKDMILDSKRVLEFGTKQEPTIKQVDDFVDKFVRLYVLPSMEDAVVEAYKEAKAPYTQARIEERTWAEYTKLFEGVSYQSGFNDIALMITQDNEVKEPQPSKEVVLN